MKLKDFLEESNTSYEAFGDIIGVTKQAVCGYVADEGKGHTNPQLTTAIKIVKATDDKVTIRELLTDSQAAEIQKFLEKIQKDPN